MNQLSCTLDRKSLTEALKTQARIVERRNTIPILSTVLLAISPDKVTMTGTDLDIYQTEELPAATTGGEGALAIDCRALNDAVKKMSGETVRIADVGGYATVQDCGTGATVRLPTLKASEFPTLAEGDALAEFNMGANSFRQALETAAVAMSTEETRYYLMGINLHTACMRPLPRTDEHEALCEELAASRRLDHADEAALPDNWRATIAAAEGEAAEAIAVRTVAMLARATRRQEIGGRIDVLEAERNVPDTLTFAATDGHRLIRVTRDLPDGAAGLPDAIVPRKAVTIMTKLIGAKPKASYVDVRANATKIVFRYGRVRIVAKLIDGTFPDYTRVIPTMNDKRLVIDGPAFTAAVEGAASVANEKTRAVTVSLDPAEPLIVACTSPASGTAATIVEESDYQADPLVIGFNAAYLTAALKAFGNSPVTVDLADAAAPTAFTSEAMADVLIVLMPMRTDGGITTRAAVERLNLGQWERFKADAEGHVKAVAAVAECQHAGARSHAYRELGRKVQNAVDYLTEGGTPRPVARQIVKYELAQAAMDWAAGNRALAMESALASIYGVPVTTVAEPAIPAATPTVDPTPAAEAVDDGQGEDFESDSGEGTCEGCGRDGFDCSRDPCADVIADRGDGDEEEGGDENPPQDPAPQDPGPLDPADAPAAPAETVVAVAADTPAVPAAAPIADVCKVLTVTGQALYVATAEFDNPAQSVLQRYNKDGTPKGERVVLRSNIERQVLPRNRGDKPVRREIPAASVPAASPVDGDVADRLAQLERLVGGLATSERVAALEAELAAAKAALAVSEGKRARSTALARRRGHAVASHRLMLQSTNQGWERERQRVTDALGERDRLAVRCDALERLHVDSASLDTAASERNGQPAIILPVQPSRPRVSQ